MCACGLAVFEELGLVRMRSCSCACDQRYEVHVCDFGGKVELGDSVRYREGMGEAEAFARFTEWVMRSPASALRDRIIRPILPDDMQGEGGRDVR